MQALQEDYDVRAENRVLELARQYEHEVDEDATDDEVCDALCNWKLAQYVLTVLGRRHCPSIAWQAHSKKSDWSS